MKKRLGYGALALAAVAVMTVARRMWPRRRASRARRWHSKWFPTGSRRS